MPNYKQDVNEQEPEVKKKRKTTSAPPKKENEFEDKAEPEKFPTKPSTDILTQSAKLKSKKWPLSNNDWKKNRPRSEDKE